MRLQRFLVALVVALLGLTVILFLVLPSAEKKDPTSGAINRTFQGVPQSGNSLGSSGAPATLTVFSDSQCPACRNFALNNLPRIVNKFVRPGKLRLKLVPVDFKGDPSKAGGKAAYAAGLYNRMWQFNSFLLLNQRADGASPEVLAKSATQAGLRPQSVLGGADSQAVAFKQGVAEARRLGVDETPSFFLSQKSGPGSRLFSNRSDASDLDRAIARLLSRSSQ